MKYSMPFALVFPLFIFVTGCGGGAAEEIADSIADQITENLNSESNDATAFRPQVDDEVGVLPSGGSDSTTSQDPETANTGSNQEEVSSVEPEGQFTRLVVSWSIPQLRENGDVIEISEIGGYILRFTHVDTGDEYTYEVNDHSVDDVAFQLDASYLQAAGTWEYQILAFDTNGLHGSYSDPQEVVMN